MFDVISRTAFFVLWAMQHGSAHRHHNHGGLAPQDPPTSQAGFRSSHKGKNINPELLNSTGMGRGWLVELVMQPAQSPDFNAIDLGFFAFLKSRLWGTNGSSMGELETIFEQYAEYDGDTLKRV